MLCRRRQPPGGQGEQLGGGLEIPVRRLRNQRIAKLFLSVVLGPFEPVEGLYYFQKPYRRRQGPE